VEGNPVSFIDPMGYFSLIDTLTNFKDEIALTFDISKVQVNIHNTVSIRKIVTTGINFIEAKINITSIKSISYTESKNVGTLGQIANIGLTTNKINNACSGGSSNECSTVVAEEASSMAGGYAAGVACAELAAPSAPMTYGCGPIIAGIACSYGGGKVGGAMGNNAAVQFQKSHITNDFIKQYNAYNEAAKTNPIGTVCALINGFGGHCP
jgi:hypothetical protein